MMIRLNLKSSTVFPRGIYLLHQPRGSLKRECDKNHHYRFFKVLKLTLISAIHPGFGFVLVVILPGPKDTRLVLPVQP